MRKITFDIETKNTFEDVGKREPESLDLAVVCIHDSETNSYSSFFEENLKDLWPIIEKTDLLIGFNSEHFDIPLLNKYYSGDLSKIKSVDLMKEIKNVLGRRIGLDAIAKATLGKGKIGHGLESITWWRNGEKDKVVKYCIEDVRITKELYDYALKNGILKYSDNGKIKDIKIQTSKWESQGNNVITHTLPF